MIRIIMQKFKNNDFGQALKILFFKFYFEKTSQHIIRGLELEY